jgi:hypothetical protein
MAHFGLKAQAIAARQAHQYGDVEQSHRRFKRAVDQALMLRGHRGFARRGDYEAFLRKVMAGRNAHRRGGGSPRSWLPWGRSRHAGWRCAGGLRHRSIGGARSTSAATPIRWRAA